MENRTRAVLRNSTTMIRVGMIVHDSSICKLPNTCGGSDLSLGRARYRVITWMSKMLTTRKIPAVMARTKCDSPSISLPGVENGEKIEVACGST